MSSRGSSPGSIDPQAPEQVASWIPATSAGMTTAIRNEKGRQRCRPFCFVGCAGAASTEGAEVVRDAGADLADHFVGLLHRREDFRLDPAVVVDALRPV